MSTLAAFVGRNAWNDVALPGAALRQEDTHVHHQIADTRIVISRKATETEPFLQLSENRLRMIVLLGWAFGSTTVFDKNRVRLLLEQRTDREIVDALQDLDGQFCGLYVSADGTVTTLQEGFGNRPMYVGTHSRGTILSSCPLSLAVLSKSDVDPITSVSNLFGEQARSPRSMFSGLRRLDFGERWVVSPASFVSQQVRVLPDRELDMSRGRAEDLVLETLRRSTNAIGEQYGKVLVDLTAGLDSRLVAALASERTRELAVTVSGRPEDLDVVLSKQIAKRMGWDWHYIPAPDACAGERFHSMDDAFATGSGEMNLLGVDSLLSIKRTAAGVAAASCGGAGGELLRDFFWNQELLRFPPSSTLDLDHLMRMRFRSSSDAAPLVRPDHLQSYLALQRADLEASLTGSPSDRKYFQLDRAYLWKISGSVPNTMRVVWPDLPSPAILATRSLVAAATSMPSKYRRGGQMTRSLIARISPELAREKTWYGTTAMPFSVRRPRDLAMQGVYASDRVTSRVVRLLNTRHQAFSPTTTDAASGDPGFRKLLFDDGYLDAGSYLTSDLYDRDALHGFLKRAATDTDFSSFSTLDALVSVEKTKRVLAQLGRLHH